MQLPSEQNGAWRDLPSGAAIVCGLAALAFWTLSIVILVGRRMGVW